MNSFSFPLPRLLLLIPYLALFGCEREAAPLPVPEAEDLLSYYEFSGNLTITMSGNVPQVTVTINRQDYAQGGELWARALPYLFLFSPGTRRLFDEHPGVGGVRVITRYDDGSLVAQALLKKEKMDLGNWNRALAAALAARQDGTRRPQLMDDLVRIGEEYTDFEYNMGNVRRAP
jgi:hypothetical protein